MRILGKLVIMSACVLVVLTSGCVSQGKYDDLEAQNRIQQDKIVETREWCNVHGLWKS